MGPRYRFATVESTQRLAVEHARRLGPTPASFVAVAQSGGRGRLDHDWRSPPGGLYLSLVRAPPAMRPSLLLPGAAASIASEIEGGYGVAVGLRWPNDLLVEHRGAYRKLGGVIGDAVEGSAGAAVVVGIGLNVAHAPLPKELVERATFLEEHTATAPDLAEVESRVVRGVDRALEELGSEEGARRLAAQARERMLGIGRPVRLDGEPVGTARAMDDLGQLWVERGDLWEPVSAGTLTIEGIA